MNYEVAFYIALAMMITALLFAYLVWSIFYHANRYDNGRIVAARKQAHAYKARLEAQQELLTERAKKVGLLHNEVVRLNEAAEEAASTIDHLTNALAAANQQINRLTIKTTVQAAISGAKDAATNIKERRVQDAQSSAD